MIQYMLSNGARLNDQNNFGETVVHMVVGSRSTFLDDSTYISEIISEEHGSSALELLQIFVDTKKCDPNCRDLNGSFSIATKLTSFR